MRLLLTVENSKRASERASLYIHGYVVYQGRHQTGEGSFGTTVVSEATDRFLAAPCHSFGWLQVESGAWRRQLFGRAIL